MAISGTDEGIATHQGGKRRPGEQCCKPKIWSYHFSRAISSDILLQIYLILARVTLKGMSVIIHYYGKPISIKYKRHVSIS